jgi:hypothetical protein
MRMLRLFERFTFKKNPSISEAAACGAKQAFNEIQKLGSSNNIDDLSKALLIIRDVQMKYPFAQYEAMRCKGQIISAMTKHPDFNKDHQTNPTPKHHS